MAACRRPAPPLIVDSIAAALDCAHAQEIIHRDVKPANILVPKRGPARLTDFGVAQIDDDAPLTVMGDILGTIEYASPEQVRGHEAPDARSDVYSLAAVTYFALTGTPPFRAADESTQAQLSVMHRQVFADPPPLRFHREDISPEVEAAVLRGLAKAPGGSLTSRQANSRPPCVPPPKPRRERRKSAPWPQHLGARALWRAAWSPLLCSARRSRVFWKTGVCAVPASPGRSGRLAYRCKTAQTSGGSPLLLRFPGRSRTTIPVPHPGLKD